MICTNAKPVQSRCCNGLFSDAEWRAISGALQLSPREAQIIEAICDGLKDAAMAERLGMSPHTVRAHLNRLHRKLSVTCRAGVLVEIFRAFRAGMVDESAPGKAIARA